jgi:hypothetical protein
MKEDETASFCEAWIVKGDSAEEYDPDGVGLNGCSVLFEHAGRYSMEFSNQGFSADDFGRTTHDEDTGEIACPFWTYATSPDVCYYDAEFKTFSRPAYDVALYRETFSKVDRFVEMSDALGHVFGAIRRRDYAKLTETSAKYGMKLGNDGTIVVDGDPFGLILAVTLTPMPEK